MLYTSRFATDALWFLVCFVVDLVTDGQLCAPRLMVVIGLLSVRQLLMAVGLLSRSPPVLRWAVLLDRWSRVVVQVVFWTYLGQALCSAVAQVPLLCVGAVVAKPTCSARRFASRSGGVAVQSGEGQVVIEISEPVVLRLPLASADDERLAMVLCRQLENPQGQPILSFQQLALAFGKNSRQDVQNHMQKLNRAGGSLAQMILQGLRCRPPTIAYEVQQLLREHWQRDPLCSNEQTLRWLQTQNLPEGTAVPTLQDLEKMPRLEGDLLTTRRALRRQLDRQQGAIRPKEKWLHRQLMEVITEQERRLEQAGIEPAVHPGVIEASTFEPPRTLSPTARRLVAQLRSLLCWHDPDSMAPQGDPAEPAPLPEPALHYGLLYCVLGLSVGQVAALVGKSKSVVYRGLCALAHAARHLDPFDPVAHFSGVLALDEKWVKIPKSFTPEERAEGKKWRFAYFAVDGLTGDLLHVDVYENTGHDSVRAFLAALRARGIRPKVVVSDMLAAYDRAVRDTFGEGVTQHYCLFHHLQAVRTRLRELAGSEWKKDQTLRRLVDDIDKIYRCKDKRTAKRRLDKVLVQRESLAMTHPQVLPLLDIIEKRFPKVANAIGRADIPMTNNITERTIKAFARHYKQMAGFESLETAQLQLSLFRFFYRMTPLREPASKQDRNKCPLERAGYQVRGVPFCDYVRHFTELWREDGPDALIGTGEPELVDAAESQTAEELAV